MIILILFFALLLVIFLIGYVDELQEDRFQEEMDEFERHLRTHDREDV